MSRRPVSLLESIGGTRLRAARLGLVVAAVSGSYAPAAIAQNGEPARLELTSSSESAKQHFALGLHDAQNVFPARATVHFEQALEADPNMGLAKAFHAFVKPGLTAAQRQEGITEALAGMSGASTPEILIATALREWAGGNAAVASPILASASGLVPGDARIASFATQLAGARGDQTDVVALWQAFLVRFPEFAPPHNVIAYTQWARGNKAAALTSVAEYARRAGNDPNPHDSYAELLQWDGRYREALGHYGRAAELAPTFNQAYVGAAEVHYLMGDMNAARQQMALAIDHAISPQARVVAQRQLASLHMLAGERERAMQVLGEAATAAEEGGFTGPAATTHQQMALTDALLNRGRTMAAHLEAAATVGGAETNGQLASVALAHAIAGEVAAARTAATRLAEAAPNSVFWQGVSKSVLAMVHLREDQPQQAWDALADADPSNWLVQSVRADVQAAMGNRDAARVRRQVVAANPQVVLGNPFAMVALAKARRN